MALHLLIDDSGHTQRSLILLPITISVEVVIISDGSNHLPVDDWAIKTPVEIWDIKTLAIGASR